MLDAGADERLVRREWVGGRQRDGALAAAEPEALQDRAERARRRGAAAGGRVGAARAGRDVLRAAVAEEPRARDRAAREGGSARGPRGAELHAAGGGLPRRARGAAQLDGVRPPPLDGAVGRLGPQVGPPAARRLPAGRLARGAAPRDPRRPAALHDAGAAAARVPAHRRRRRALRRHDSCSRGGSAATRPAGGGPCCSTARASTRRGSPSSPSAARRSRRCASGCASSRRPPPPRASRRRRRRRTSGARARPGAPPLPRGPRSPYADDDGYATRSPARAGSRNWGWRVGGGGAERERDRDGNVWSAATGRKSPSRFARTTSLFIDDEDDADGVSELIDVTVRNARNKPLGLNVRDGYVSHVAAGSPASHKLHVGDKIVSVDGKMFDRYTPFSPDLSAGEHHFRVQRPRSSRRKTPATATSAAEPRRPRTIM